MAKITSDIAENRLGDVPQEKQFWCRDGQILKNLSELESALRLIADEIFRYHLNQTKNDFAKWFIDVIGDVELVKLLQKSSARVQAVRLSATDSTWLRNKAVSG